MSRNNNHTTGNQLDCLYRRLFIGIDLSRQTNTNILQKINFVGKLEKDNGTPTFYIAEK